MHLSCDIQKNYMEMTPIPLGNSELGSMPQIELGQVNCTPNNCKLWVCYKNFRSIEDHELGIAKVHDH